MDRRPVTLDFSRARVACDSRDDEAFSLRIVVNERQQLLGMGVVSGELDCVRKKAGVKAVLHGSTVQKGELRTYRIDLGKECGRRHGDGIHRGFAFEHVLHFELANIPFEGTEAALPAPQPEPQPSIPCRRGSPLFPREC